MNEESIDVMSSRRDAVKFTAVIAILLMALVALNAPITFRGWDAGSTQVASAQSGIVDEDAVADVAETANPATVTILNLQDQPTQFGQTNGVEVPVGTGSGYIIDAEGHVVTNNHVVEGAAELKVMFIDGTTVDATLVGTDPYQDVAVLKLELEAGQELPAIVSFGDSSTVRVGDTVIAIGSPYGEYTNTVTAGIVNATGRSLDTGYGYLLPNLLQHDADIYPGNSGGPLLNTDGEVIGMNVAKVVEQTMDYSTEEANIGFAIDSNAIQEIVDQILDQGYVSRAYLGVRTQMTFQGQGVVSVEPGGPADVAGLQAGDIITAIDGERIDFDYPFINALLFDREADDKVTLTVERNGEEIDLRVTLGERPLDVA